MSEDNKRVVLQFMEAMSTGNAALGAPCITEDACAIAKGYGKFAGRREADVMIGMIEAFNTLVPGGLKFEILSVIGDGDRVAVEAEGNAVTNEGMPYRNQYCFVFELRGGKIAQVNEYFCNVHADEVLWPLVERMQAQS